MTRRGGGPRSRPVPLGRSVHQSLLTMISHYSPAIAIKVLYWADQSRLKATPLGLGLAPWIRRSTTITPRYSINQKSYLLHASVASKRAVLETTSKQACELQRVVVPSKGSFCGDDDDMHAEKAGLWGGFLKPRGCPFAFLLQHPRTNNNWR